MTWTERIDKRNQRNKTWQDSERPNKFSLDATLAALHYESETDSGVFDTAIDATPVRVTNPQFDGWRITQSGWHYALGKDLASHGDQDGWIGFGGRQGQNWLKFRLAKVGYLHWPTRAWSDIGGEPNYDRGNLTQQTSEIEFATDGSTQPIGSVANWANIWETPSGGNLSALWGISGDRLKEEITVNQAGREWIAANRPPTTPLDETYFGFVFQLDWSDIPKVYRQGLLQDVEGDFADDDQSIELRDALDKFLAFMPISDVRVPSDDPRLVISQPLRKRFYKHTDGNYYLLLGVRADILNGMPAGDLVFDPTIDPDPAQVPSSSDDASQISGGINLTATAYIIDQTWEYLGLRWTGIAIPDGADIDNATNDLCIYGSGYDEPYHDVWAHDTAAPPTFTTDTWNISNRTPTTASVLVQHWDFGAGAGHWMSEYITLDDISTIIQELTSSYSYQLGSSIVLMYVSAPGSSSSWDLGVRTWNYVPTGVYGAKLHIEYTDPERTSLSAFVKTWEPANSSLSVFLKTWEPASSSLSAFVQSPRPVQVAQALAYAEISGKVTRVSQAIAYAEIHDAQPINTSLSAYLSTWEPANSSLSVFLKTWDPASSSLSSYLEGESTALVTQFPVEALVQPDTQAARVTQLPVEALVQPDTQAARVTQFPVEVALENLERSSLSAFIYGDVRSALPAYLTGPITYARVTQVVAEAVVQPTDLNARVTQLVAEAVVQPTDVEARVTQVVVEVVRSVQEQSSLSAYLNGTGEASSSLSAYLTGPTGTPVSSSLSAYLYSAETSLTDQEAYIRGANEGASSLSAFILSGPESALSAYAHGKTSAQSSLSAYIPSGFRFTSLDAYLKGVDTDASSLSAYIYAGTKVTSSLSAFIWGAAPVTSSQAAYLYSNVYVVSTRPAYLLCGTSTTSSLSAFIYGGGDMKSYAYAYLEGILGKTGSLDAYLFAGLLGTGSMSAYLEGIPLVETEISAYLEGGSGYLVGSLDAYAEGIPEVVYWQSAFLEGSIDVTSSLSVYLSGKILVRSSLDAYMYGEHDSNLSAYLTGIDTDASSLDAFAEGFGAFGITSQDAFIEGKAPGITSMPAFLEGYPVYFPDPSSLDAYMEGIYGASSYMGKVWMHGLVPATPDSLSSYLYGHIETNSSLGAYMVAIVENERSSLHAFMGDAPVRSSLSCYLTEAVMAEYPYIVLTNSDSSISEQFRVVAEGYDDGMLDKSASISKTIGGGVDVAMGDTYTTWNPIIRVRHEEPESNYGNLTDLQDLYKLSNPGGTPTNVITFTDNHNVGHSVYMLGSFKKQYIGAHVEGNQAWLFVKLQLVEKT